MTDNNDNDPDIGFNRFALDVEWQRQVDLVSFYSVRQADSKKELDEAKERLEIVIANVARDMRASPADYGLGIKASETAIKTALPTVESHMDARREVRECQYRVDLLAGKMRGLSERGNGLGDNVRLHLAGYFAQPSLPMSPSSKELEKALSKEKEMTEKSRRKHSREESS